MKKIIVGIYALLLYTSCNEKIVVCNRIGIRKEENI